MKPFVAMLLAASLPLPLIAAEPASMKFDPTPYSQKVTGCDRLASHPEDPFKVSPGIGSAEVDTVAAIAACRAVLAKDPGNPRIQYQLARSLAYAGQGEEALPLLEKAAELKYPQALFVTGYLYLDGILKAPKKPCRAAELIREAGVYGRMAGLVGYPAYALEGRFTECDSNPDSKEIAAFLAAAKAAKPDFYEGLVITALTRELDATKSGK